MDSVAFVKIIELVIIPSLVKLPTRINNDLDSNCVYVIYSIIVINIMTNI